jgi:opacity protein-like surface antigen
LIFALAIFPFITFAQKGSHYLQVSGQAAIPTGRLADIVKTGFGASAKGMYGIGKLPQHLTLEAGYNRFAVKDLPSDASAHYSAIPVYLGYRANLSGVLLESQAGLSFNRIAGSGPGGTASASQTAFGWSLGAGYVFNSVELGVRYQSSEKGDDVQKVRFIGIRLGYNFGL